ncbi:MAG: hypothetical protein ABMB14_18640 [Myxococcota bacterium]
MDGLPLTGRMVTGQFGLRTRPTGQGTAATVYLTLPLPIPGTDWDRWVEGGLLVHDRGAALAFAAEVAAWLGVPCPAPSGRAVHLSYNWAISKLTLESGDAHAEVYLNLIDGGEPTEVFLALATPRVVTLDEKDEGYREDLVGLLVDGLIAGVR